MFAYGKKETKFKRLDEIVILYSSMEFKFHSNRFYCIYIKSSVIKRYSVAVVTLYYKCTESVRVCVCI